MIDYPASLLSVAGARTGIAPTHLLDIEAADGDIYYLASRRTGAPAAIVPPVPSNVITAGSVASAGAGQHSGPQNVTNTGGTIYIEAGHTGDATITWSGFGSALTSGILEFIISTNDELPALCEIVLSDGVHSHVVGPVLGANTFDLSSLTGGWDLSALTVTLHVWRTVYSGYGAISAVVSGLDIQLPPPPPPEAPVYRPWLLSVGAWRFFRHVQTLSGSFVVQNVSGDSMARDMEKVLRTSSLEGALYVYREWDEAAQAAYREVHGTLTVDDVSATEVMLKASGLLNASQGDPLGETYSETCQLVWGSRRCGATGSVECKYSFQTCQVVERFMGVLNSYEKNFAEAVVTPVQKTMNRRRKI